VFKFHLSVVNQHRDRIDSDLDAGDLPEPTPFTDKSAKPRHLFVGNCFEWSAEASAVASFNLNKHPSIFIASN
jgi:hypothetical protein